METSAEGGSSKRRRIARACDSCRTKKSRCDGAEPCANCSALDHLCTYSISSSSGRQIVVNREYIVGLEERICRLEANAGLPSVASSGSAPKASSGQPDSPAHPWGLNNLASVAVGTQSRMPSPEPVDGMGLLRYEDPPDAEQFYGNASGVSFHTLLSRTLLLAPSPSVSGTVPSTINPIKDGVLTIKTELPTQAQADKLHAVYFSGTAFLYPVVHEDTVRSSFKDILKGVLPQKAASAALALHLIIFAMAEQVGNGSTSAARAYFRKAEEVMDRYRSSMECLAGVQARFLAALVLQAAGNPAKSWYMSGAAIRTAHAIGLHTNWAPSKDSLRDKELRRRTWWALACFERLLSATLGRPSSIACLRQGPAIPERLDGEPVNLVDVLRHSIAFYRILDRVVDDSGFESDSEGRAGKAVLDDIGKIEHEFSVAVAACPPSLVPPSKSDVATWSPQAVVLTLRRLTLHLMAHRPTLVEAVQSVGKYIPPPAANDGDFYTRHLKEQQKSASLGMALAASLASAIECTRVLAESEGLDTLSARWYRVAYALNAFMTIAAALTLDLSKWPLFVNVTTHELFQALRTGRAVVAKIAEDSSLASATRALPLCDQILSSFGIMPLADFTMPMTGPSDITFSNTDFSDAASNPLVIDWSLLAADLTGPFISPFLSGDLQ